MTAKLILMQGLPGSGKSTRAEKLADTLDVIRINRDLLREMLHFGVYSSSRETIIIYAEVEIVTMFLNIGKSVIVDDTNIRPVTLDMWKRCAEAAGVEFEIITMNTDIEECIRRDSLRENPVGEEAIRKMAEYEA